MIISHKGAVPPPTTALRPPCGHFDERRRSYARRTAEWTLSQETATNPGLTDRSMGASTGIDNQQMDPASHA